VGAGSGCLQAPAYPNPDQLSTNSVADETGPDVISRVEEG
jgi:hypothetical protein